MKMRMAWVALTAAAGLSAWADGDADLQLGRRVFTQLAQPSCTVCHALEAAGAAGKIGPSLDALDPDADRVLKAVRDGIGAMPAYGERLTREQLNAVAAYVAAVSGGVSRELITTTAAPTARVPTCNGHGHEASRVGPAGSGYCGLRR